MQVVHSLQQLYRYRALAEILITRDLKARYRGTVFGFFWIMLNPLIFTMIYVVVFSNIFRVEMENFQVFVLAGILPWLCFSATISEATHSVIGNGGLIRKVLLPSEIFPLVSVGTQLVHYLFSVPILFGFMLWYSIPISWNLLFFPLILFVQALFTFGLSMMVSVLTVQFRDLQQTIPNLLLIWFFLTPILYPMSMVPERLGTMLALNPLVYLVGAYRDIFLYDSTPSLGALLLVAVLSCLLVVLGLVFFEQRREFIAEEV